MADTSPTERILMCKICSEFKAKNNCMNCSKMMCLKCTKYYYHKWSEETLSLCHKCREREHKKIREKEEVERAIQPDCAII